MSTRKDFKQKLQRALDEIESAQSYVEDAMGDCGDVDEVIEKIDSLDVLECLEFGLPHIEEKYGAASLEAISVRGAIVKLTPKGKAA